jgi:hypothetical protein
VHLSVAGEPREIDPAAVVDADVPVAAFVSRPGRAGTAEGHGLNALEAAENCAQLSDRFRQLVHGDRQYR